ncbi:MAG: SGNH/GDSL hydrolase family protein, partial [Lentisphaeria bacterium]|nr:SGNH/GDSL hydrolase family protein [Lentisphaeria bacterium]
ASYAKARFLDPAALRRGEEWRLGCPPWDTIPGSLRSSFAGRELLHATRPGAALSFAFDGNAAALYVLAGPDAGAVDVTVDQGGPVRIELYHPFSANLHYPRTVILADGLDEGQHHVSLTTAPAADRPDGGTAVRVLGIGVNGR